jgi:hypothetical protein
MSPLKHINLSLAIGQEIGVGPNNERAIITKIEFHEKSGEICLNTTQGPRKALTFRLFPECVPTITESNAADRYR